MRQIVASSCIERRLRQRAALGNKSICDLVDNYNDNSDDGHGAFVVVEDSDLDRVRRAQHFMFASCDKLPHPQAAIVVYGPGTFTNKGTDHAAHHSSDEVDVPRSYNRTYNRHNR